MQHITYTDARANLAAVLNRVNDDAEPVAISRKNGPGVVLVGEDEYNSMIETLYLFSNPANATHLKASLDELDNGDIETIDV